MGDRQNYYTVLGLSSSASFEEVRAAYRKLVKQWHPDQFYHDLNQRQHAHEMITQINEAYEFFKSQSQVFPESESDRPHNRDSSTIYYTRQTTANEHYERGVTFAKLGEYADAIDAFSVAIRLDSTHADAYQYRGFIYSVLGYEHRANSDLNKASELQRKTESASSAKSHHHKSTNRIDSISSEFSQEQLWRCIQVLIGHRDTISGLAFSRDRHVLISSSWDGEIRLWNLKTGETFGVLKQEDAVYAIALSPEGEHLASAGRDGSVRIWHWKTGSLIRTLRGHSSTVHSLAFAPNRRHIISASFDQTLKLWDVQQGAMLHTFTGHTTPIWAVSINPDGQTIISGGEDQQIRLWNLQTYQLIHTCPYTGRNIYAIASHPNRQDVVMGTGDRQLLKFNIHTQMVTPVANCHVQPIRSVAISPNGQWIASGGIDRTVSICELGSPPMPLNGHIGGVLSIAFSPDSTLLASAGEDKSIRLWTL